MSGRTTWLCRSCRCPLLLMLLLLVAVTWSGGQMRAHAEPGTPLSLSWPFEAGADWLIVQGYNATTHTGDHRYAFDLVLADAGAGSLASRTAGQAVLAAADGELLPFFEASSGCYIVRHDAATAEGAYYFTLYAHLEPAVDVSQPTVRRVRQGQALGTVAAAGRRANGAMAHLHFCLLASRDPLCAVNSRTPLPFGAFIPGWSFPQDGSANQYNGRVVSLVQPAPAATAPAGPGEQPLAASVQVSETVAAPTVTATVIPTPTTTLTATPLPSATPPPPTATPTATPPPSATPTATASPTPSPSATPSATATLAPTATPAPTATAAPTARPPNTGPLVPEAGVPYGLAVACVGLAALAWRKVRL